MLAGKLIPSSDAYVSLATYYAPDLTVQWRLPLGIACVGPIVLLIGLPFIPGKFFLFPNASHLWLTGLYRESTVPLMDWQE